ncbi:glutamine synthetase [Georhizobium profundi]|uniref:Glutamine synthetase n=1 Tax=Georhizobium profundi TaxID=2341112 RepID=A0A3Q8XN94_9HYPH|nr:glutamine synthetase family protein [Georhizobium profundi]AZN70162.1 glutamine synthetase [Georhizobium profundi]
MAAYDLKTLKADIKSGDIDTVLVCFPDMQGRLIGKRFQAEFFVEGALDETHGCDYLLANDIDMEPVPGYDVANWQRGYGDFVMKPDLATLMKAHWLEGTAIVLCDLVDHHHHDPVPHSPRAILKTQLERLDALGLMANFASELEFYLFDEDYRTIHEKGFRGLKTAGYYIEDYHIFQTTKEEPVMREIRRKLQASGIPIENSKGEWGPGQEEINVRYADALTMADRHVVMKNAIKEIAYAQGKAVTFMAKWDYGLAGSSSHVHMSLAKDGKNAFVDENDKLGMSKLMKHYVAGLLKYAADITVLLAPYVNSYKRFQAGTFAPTKAIWSGDNRTAGFRLCGENTKGIRIECRIGGADLNPYLAYAGMIAAGLKGIEDELELEPPYTGDAYSGEKLPEIPKTLRAAIAAFRGSSMLKDALGEQVISHYAHTADWEQLEYDRRVTDWEIKRGFERC